MTQVFLSLAEMLNTHPQVSQAVVTLAGYHRPQDGGGGTFYWDAADTTPEDGGTVIAPEGVKIGRYVRVRESHYVNVKWFGAKGDGNADDTAAIQAAIYELPETGGTVTVPGGTYVISETIRIGEGDGVTPSRKNGIKLVGNGTGVGHYTTSQTKFVAVKPMETVISVSGPVTDCVLQGFSLNVKDMADVGIRITAMSGSLVDRVHVSRQKKIGFELTSGTAKGTESRNNQFVQCGCANHAENTVSIRIGGDDRNGVPVRDCLFTACRFDTAQRDQSIALWMQYAEGITFRRCHLNVYKPETAKGLLLDATGHDGYPRKCSFYDCSITRGYVKEDETRKIGYNFFMGNGTYDHEKIEPNPHLFGITDIGTIL